MQPLLVKTLRGVTIVACGLLFLVGTHFATQRIIESEGEKFLDGINQTALRRAENAIDYSARILETLVREHANCSDASLQATRLRVYQNNLIKDIRVADENGTVRCAAYAETLEFDKTWTRFADMLPATDPTIRLFRVERFASDALGVLYAATGSETLVAIVGIDASQFDILPPELRGSGRVSLVLSNDMILAQSGADDARNARFVVVDRQSGRYPIRAQTAVLKTAVHSWNSAPFLGLTVAAGLVGLLVGALAARLIGASPNPMSAMDAAIANREFVPFFQPVFALDDHAIVGCEALMRWTPPDGRVIAPAAFMPLAESSGRIETMTWLLLEDALVALRPALLRDHRFKLSFNVVPRHLLAAEFPARLRTVVRQAGASPAQIVVEITERQEFDDLDRAAQVVAALQAEGFRIAIDDVGVGHSGLSSIQKLKADILKIDKFFVDSIELGETARAVIVMLVGLARELGMAVVAEGIETDAQRRTLLACQVPEGQGYVFAPALPAKAFLALLDANARGLPSGRAPAAVPAEVI